MRARLAVGVFLLCVAAVVLYDLDRQYLHGKGRAVLFDVIHKTPPQTLLVLCASAVGYILTSWMQRKSPQTTNHGSSRFATRGETRPYRFPAWWKRWYERRQGHTPQSRFVVGRYKGLTIALSEKQQESNVFIVGPIGQGKSSGLIIPAILCEEGSRSLVITDPKGELLAITGGAVAQHHQVMVFAPTTPIRSQCYNPLASLHTFEDAQDFAHCWVVNTGESPDPFWMNNTILLVLAIIVHLRATEPETPFFRLGDIIMGSSFEEIKEILTSSPSMIARNTAAMFLKNVSLNERLAGSIMTDLANRFLLLQSPEIRQVTARHEIDFNAMVDRPIALYLSVPHSAAKRCYPLTACMMMQLFSTLEKRAEQSPTRALPRGIVCYLDEFANIGRILHMGEYVTTIRSKRVALVLAIQNFSQLQDIYGEKEADTLLANCITKLVLPGAGQTEVEYFSRRIGETTVPTYSRNQSANDRGESEGWTQGETGRRLMTPDEIRRMEKGSILMLTDVLAPLLIKSTPYYQDRALRRRANLPYQQKQSRPSTQTSPGASGIAMSRPIVLPYQQKNQSRHPQDQQDQYFSPE